MTTDRASNPGGEERGVTEVLLVANLAVTTAKVSLDLAKELKKPPPDKK